MKTVDVVHRPGLFKRENTRGQWRVRVFVVNGQVTVLITDLGEKNDGQSVTNAIEMIVSSLVAQGLVIGPAVFIEHYEREFPLRDDFYRVYLDGPTQWQQLARPAVVELIGRASECELDDRSCRNPRIAEQADRVRYSNDPFIGSRLPEPDATVKRRLEIADGAISRQEIRALVEAGASERKIQKLLKRDLSVMAEAYAKPYGEYICFSEFPLGDGFVDFAVFTGRSRMDVVLVEVKGAGFNLVNSNHYGSFHHKVHEAAGQICKRVGVVYRNMESFRQQVHALRARAEAGDAAHNAFIGPVLELMVDPDKDINVRTVVIGGRTVDDLSESRKRQDYESGSVPPIHIESWDTWLRRLTRD